MTTTVQDLVDILDSQLSLSSSPIQQLPAELFLLIFAECYPVCRVFPYAVHNGSETIPTTLFTLSTVCSSWRSIILTAPSLWSTIVINLNHPPTQQSPRILSRILELSSEAGLDISLFLNKKESLESTETPKESRTLIRTLVSTPNADRICSLAIAGNEDPLYSVNRQISLPNLRVFHFCHASYPVLYTDFTAFSFLVSAPRLRTVGLTDGTFINALAYQLHNVQSLRALNLRDGEVIQSIRILTQLPNLERIAVEFQSELSWPQEQGSITLPVLTDLNIYVAYSTTPKPIGEAKATYVDPLPRFLSYIRVPSLKRFYLDHGERLDTDPRYWPHSTFMSFIAPLKGLEDVALLFTRGLSVAMLLSVLRSLPGLKRLELSGLGNEDEAGDGYTITPGFLSELVWPEHAQKEDVILPNLTHLSLSLLRYDALASRLAEVVRVVESRSTQTLEYLHLEVDGDFSLPSVVQSFQRIRRCPGDKFRVWIEFVARLLPRVVILIR